MVDGRPLSPLRRGVWSALKLEKGGEYMGKLTPDDRYIAIQNLHDRLTSAIEKTARGITDEEIQDAWLFACEQVGVKPKVGTSEPEKK